ncbi:primary-amine oxidase, partial [Phenoliferia sp. Uapishka_3]
MAPHPLDSLSASEIALASGTFRSELLRRGIRSVKSCYVTLVERKPPSMIPTEVPSTDDFPRLAPKLEVIAYLGIATSPTDFTPDKSGVLPKRRAEASLIDTVTGEVYVLTAELKLDGTAFVDSVEKLPKGVQPAITMEELSISEEAVRNDPEVIRLCAEVGITKEQIMCDCWSIGYEHRFGEEKRLQQAFLYARLGKDEHLYAHPLDFNCVVDANAGKVLKIDFAPHRSNPNRPDALSGTTEPHSVEGDSLQDSGRARIPPPMDRQDYLPELIAEKAAAEGKTWDVRRDVKPLHVQQPQGVSFSMEGNRLKWQNWDMHIGYNFREGIVLNTVQYFDKDEGRLRPIIYRASFAEMVVPYAAPEWPHPRKFAFDVGEYGLGMMANSLTLGCDCLGAIHCEHPSFMLWNLQASRLVYGELIGDFQLERETLVEKQGAYQRLILPVSPTDLDAQMSDHAGNAVPLPRCVCIHEEDDGLLWKHSDFRPGGRAHSVRSRKLVIQMICTVANYDYAFAWEFKQDGTMGFEIKLTGILNVYTLAEGEKCDAFGTEVSPRVQAHHHQHIFCLRMDPMIDGLNNSVSETEVHQVEAPTGSPDNWAGNGFYANRTILGTTAEGARMSNALTGRHWTILNEDKTHYSSKAPVGFKIMVKDPVPLLAKPDSIVGRRATFAKKDLWVTPYVDQQLFPAGKFVQQTPTAPKDSLEYWMEGERNIRRTDVVTWLTFGITHLPRPEDWPVMPYEKVSFMIKPVGFFRANPGLDVPSGKDMESVNALKTCCAKL